jgi:hypothetical protein
VERKFVLAVKEKGSVESSTSSHTPIGRLELGRQTTFQGSVERTSTAGPGG